MSTQLRSPKVVQYTVIMRVLGVLYGIAAFVFFFFPGFIFDIVNFPPRQFGTLGVMPDRAELFWLPLATSMMLMLVILCFGAASNPRNRLPAWTQAASKLCSSTGYLYLFLVHEQYFAYLLGFVTDFPIFLFVVWLTKRCAAGIEEERGETPA